MTRRQSILPEIPEEGVFRWETLRRVSPGVSGPSCLLPGQLPARKLVDPRRDSRWRRIRRETLRRDSGRCLRCGERAHEVDHVVELLDGGDPFSPANLQSLCRECHRLKTDGARQDRIRRLVARFGPITYCHRCSGTGRCPTCPGGPHPCSVCLGNRIVPAGPGWEEIIPQALLVALGDGPLRGAVRVRRHGF